MTRARTGVSFASPNCCSAITVVDPTCMPTVYDDGEHHTGNPRCLKKTVYLWSPDLLSLSLMHGMFFSLPKTLDHSFELSACRRCSLFLSLLPLVLLLVLLMVLVPCLQTGCRGPREEVDHHARAIA